MSALPTAVVLFLDVSVRLFNSSLFCPASRLVLHLDVSALQVLSASLHLDVSVYKYLVIHLGVSVYKYLVIHLDMSVYKYLVIHLDVSVY